METTSAVEAAGDRRGFLAKTIALVLGAVAYAAPVAAGIVAALNPLRQKSRAGQFLRLASLDVLPLGGPPQRFPVIADRVDAWNRFANQPVGAVFLQRTGDKKVSAIHVVCPHAGCSVTYNEEKNEYLCPCHNAHFDLTGKRTDETSPSPRDLDTLEVDRGRLQDGEVWVNFENFRTGTPKKIAEA